MAARGIAISARAQQGLTSKDLAEPWWQHHGFIQCANYRQGTFLASRPVYTMSDRSFFQSREKKPKASSEKQLQDKIPKRTRIASFDMAHDVEQDQVKKAFMEAGEVVRFDFYNTRHLAVVEYSTEEAAQNAVYQLTGFNLMGQPLKLQLLSLNFHTLGRDLPSPGKNLPVHLRMTACVKGFDPSLDVGTIRSMLKEHFECGGLKSLITPVNSDNTSTGKAYIRYALVRSFRSALKLHGSKLGGHELCVTEWPEFPWYKEDGSKTISAGDAGLVDQHTAEASFGTQELFSVAAGNTSTPLKLSQSCEVPEVQKDSNGHTSWRGKRIRLV